MEEPNPQKQHLLSKFRPLLPIVLLVAALLITGSALYILKTRKAAPVAPSGPSTSESDESNDTDQDQPSDYEFTVLIGEKANTPGVASVKLKTRVYFENHDTKPHGIMADSGNEPGASQFGKEVIEPNDGYSFLFLNAGRYKYNDPYDSSRSGEIIVE